ncbi:MAG: aminoglycoside phosphotransferase family protein [Polyangiales bacterium]
MNEVPDEVMAAWPALEGARSRRYGTGLINETFLAEGPRGRVVVQRMHPMFSPEINDDIDAVTAHLAARGVTTPRVLPTALGTRWLTHDDGGGPRPWRALSWVEHTRVYDKVRAPAVARSGAAMVGSFHRAMSDFGGSYRAARQGVHDTPRHLKNLRAALAAHPSHRLFDEVAPAADALFAAADATEFVPPMRARNSHGDLKISNLLFDDDDRCVCLVDLDSVSQMPLPLELGDAMRSWCNPAGEDATRTEVDLAVFAALVSGYASTGRDEVIPEERDALVTGFAQIALELTARFLADALNESYFGWNPARFDSRGAHNLTRARGQWALYEAALRSRAALERSVRDAFGGAA